MLRYDSVRDYIAVAPQRIADAYELLQQPTWKPDAHNAGHRHLRAAVYLAGYAVECALKTYIVTVEFQCDRSHRRRFSEAVARRKERGEAPALSGRRTHNLVLLLRASRLETAMGTEERLRKHWGMLVKWEPDWRYNPRLYTSRSEARAIVEAASALHDWVNEQRLRLKEDTDGNDEPRLRYSEIESRGRASHTAAARHH
jgi:hypothetical protein